MPGTELTIAFFVAAAVFAYMPGPSTMYAAAQTLAGGRQAGLHAALGIHVGGYVHVLAAALGLAILFSAIPLLYAAFKLAGAAYLVWLGVQLFFTEAERQPDEPAEQQPLNRSFWQSATVEILNPKTAVFYVAFLPQFTDPTATLPIWTQLLILGTIVNLMFSSADLICVVLAEKVKTALQNSSRANSIAQKIGGSILILLGLNLALSR